MLFVSFVGKFILLLFEVDRVGRIESEMLLHIYIYSYVWVSVCVSLYSVVYSLLIRTNNQIANLFEKLMSSFVCHRYPCFVRFTLRIEKKAVFPSININQMKSMNMHRRKRSNNNITFALILSIMRFWLLSSEPISMAIFRKLPAKFTIHRSQIVAINHCQ